MRKYLYTKYIRSQYVALYDGSCGLCQRSMFHLLMLDWLHALQPINFRDAAMRRSHAPGVAMEDLDRSMHVRLPDGTYKTGFDGIRALAWSLPPLWPLVPFLYLPGVAPLGRRIYAAIAKRRLRCDHEFCA